MMWFATLFGPATQIAPSKIAGVKPRVQQIVGEKESATLVRGQDDYHHFLPEPVCEIDLAPENVAFQLAAERMKREVYDTA